MQAGCSDGRRPQAQAGAARLVQRIGSYPCRYAHTYPHACPVCLPRARLRLAWLLARTKAAPVGVSMITATSVLDHVSGVPPPPPNTPTPTTHHHHHHHPIIALLQVQRLQQLLGVLDAIPPRLRRTLEDYKLHEETMDLVQGVLADIVSGAGRLACVAPQAGAAARGVSAFARLPAAASPCASRRGSPCWLDSPCQGSLWLPANGPQRPPSRRVLDSEVPSCHKRRCQASKPCQPRTSATRTVSPSRTAGRLDNPHGGVAARGLWSGSAQ